MFFGWPSLCNTHMTIRHQGESVCMRQEGKVFYPINLLSAYFQSYQVAEEERINSSNFRG